MEFKIYKEKNNQTFTYAVEEISYYLKKIFDCKISEVANNKDSNLILSDLKENIDKDHIIIKKTDDNLIIKSNSDVGILIGVYRFLNELGVFFPRPSRKNDIISKLNHKDYEKKIIEIDELASYKHRGVCIEGADSLENVIDFIDWLPKIGMNSFFIQFDNPYTFLNRWYSHEFNPYFDKEDITKEDFVKMSEIIDKEINKISLNHHRVGHGWTGQVLGYKSEYGWDKVDSISDEKIKYIAKLDGERKLFKDAPMLTSLDFSNDEVGKIMIEKIVEYTKKRPDVDYLHVWLSDAYNNICECDKCDNELIADQYVRILNDLDKNLKKENIDTKICFLIYNELLWAPIREKIENQDRFVMMFAPISRTFEKSYKDVDYNNGIEKPKEYVKNKITLPSSLEENLSYLFEWQKKFDGDSFIYDYPLGRAHYGDLGYMQISKVIYDDISYLYKLNLNGYISCQELRAGFPNNLPNYVMGKMLWNRKLTYEEIKEEYFKNLYGKDYKKALEYLEKISSLSSADYFNAIGSRENKELSLKYEKLYNIAASFLDTIKFNIEENANNIKREWIILSYHRQYILNLSKSLSYLSNGNEKEAKKLWQEVLDYIRKSEYYLQEYFDVYRVIEVAMNYAGLKI